MIKIVKIMCQDRLIFMIGIRYIERPTCCWNECLGHLQVGCTGAATYFLTEGVLMGCGQNENGILGVGHRGDVFEPALINTRGHRYIWQGCQWDHTFTISSLDTFADYIFKCIFLKKILFWFAYFPVFQLTISQHQCRTCHDPNQWWPSLVLRLYVTRAPVQYKNVVLPVQEICGDR